MIFLYAIRVRFPFDVRRNVYVSICERISWILWTIWSPPSLPWHLTALNDHEGSKLNWTKRNETKRKRFLVSGRRPEPSIGFIRSDHPSGPRMGREREGGDASCESRPLLCLDKDHGLSLELMRFPLSLCTIWRCGGEGSCKEKFCREVLVSRWLAADGGI